MEIEDFGDDEIIMEYFFRGLHNEEMSVDTSELSLVQKMFLEKVVDYISTAGPLELLKLEEFIDNENTTHIGHTR